MIITGTIKSKGMRKQSNETIMELGIYIDNYHGVQNVIIYQNDLWKKLENVSLDDTVSLEVYNGKEENVLKLVATKVISIRKAT